MYVGNISAYIANDDRYDYYLFKCTSKPKDAEYDKMFNLDGNKLPVKEGELYCEVLWLNNVPKTTKWYSVM